MSEQPPTRAQLERALDRAEAWLGPVCDHCREPVRHDANGYYVGADDTSDCAASPDGHTVDGSSR